MYSTNDYRNYAVMDISHSGVKGMKWHLRRYQNYDGSLTSLGREHYGYGQRRRGRPSIVDEDINNLASIGSRGYKESKTRSYDAARLEWEADKLEKRISKNQDKSNKLNIKLNNQAIKTTKLDTKLLKLDSDTDKFVKTNEKLNKSQAEVAKIDTKIRKLDKTIKKDSAKLAKMVSKRDAKIQYLSEEEIEAGRAKLESVINRNKNTLIGTTVGAAVGAAVGGSSLSTALGAEAGAIAGIAGSIAIDALTGNTKRYSELNSAAVNAYAKNTSSKLIKDFANEQNIKIGSNSQKELEEQLYALLQEQIRKRR